MTSQSFGQCQVALAYENYCVADPESLETPAMLLFQELMEHNIRSVCEMVGGGQNLVVHVKTHKCEAVARRQLEHGIDGFKCATLKELEMVLQAGACNAILAYPQVQKRKIERLFDLVARFPDASIAAVVSSPLHVDLLMNAAEQHEQILQVMLDLDVGMHRTGIRFGADATELYRRVNEHPLLRGAGIHWYDGHDHFSDETQRRARVEGHIKSVRDYQQQLESEGLPVPRIVAGGSWSFPYYARAEGMQGSPGTCIYWDAGYAKDMPDMPFHCAVLILTQVVDIFPDEGMFTTDLGCKGISSDLPEEDRAVLLGYESAKLVLHSEEHGVFRIDGELPEVGDYLLAIPGHICPTTIRYPGCHVIDGSGQVTDYFIHTARDRL